MYRRFKTRTHMYSIPKKNTKIFEKKYICIVD